MQDEIKVLLSLHRQSPAAGEKITPAIRQNQLEGMSILLVEDNEMNRMLATTVLENYGARVTQAYNGQVAIEKMEETAFDLVLMDLQMPVMNGLEATRYIREKISKTIPIIALTANAIKGESNKCQEAGMNNFLSKPFEETILIAMIDSHVRGTGGSPGGFGVPASNEAVLPPAAGYSLQMLEQVTRGDKQCLNRMLSTFVNTIVPVLPAIREAWKRQDIITIRRLSHKIKPGIDSLQVAGAKNEIRLLEAWPDEKGCGPEMEALIEKINAVLQRVATDIKAMLPGDGNTLA